MLLGVGSAFAATITVDSTSDVAMVDGLCTLREAITAANSNAGVDCTGGDAAPIQDVIAFNIPGPGMHTIQPLANLATITETVFINGYSQPGASPNTLAIGTDAVLLIELDGSLNLDSRPIGLHVNGPDCEVRGLVINGFDARGVQVNAGGTNVIVAGNYLGTDVTGMIGVPNNGGVDVAGSNVLIGGSSPADRNVISGNSFVGVFVSQNAGVNTRLQGNYIGTDACGRGVISNSMGILLQNSKYGFLIDQNIISGCTNDGVLAGDPKATIINNLVGTDASGVSPLPNQAWIVIFPSIQNSLDSQILSPGIGTVKGFSLSDGIAIVEATGFVCQVGWLGGGARNRRAYDSRAPCGAGCGDRSSGDELELQGRRAQDPAYRADG